jgi:hypothetical protein
MVWTSGKGLCCLRRKHKELLGLWYLLIWGLVPKGWLVYSIYQIAYLWLVYFLNFGYTWLESLLEKILKSFSLWKKLPGWNGIHRRNSGFQMGDVQGVCMEVHREAR